MSGLRAGQIVTGIVHSAAPFGLFVRLPGGDFGLVELPNYSDASPVDRGTFPAVGAAVTCLVLAVEPTPQGIRVALSMKPSALARAR